MFQESSKHRFIMQHIVSKEISKVTDTEGLMKPFDGTQIGKQMVLGRRRGKTKRLCMLRKIENFEDFKR
jgi:hypothetical protein